MIIMMLMVIIITNIYVDNNDKNLEAFRFSREDRQGLLHSALN